MISKVLLTHRLWFVIVLLALDSAFFTLTDANKVTSVALILGFLLLATTLYLCLSRLVSLARVYGLPLSHHQRRFAVFGTVIIGGVIALQSMGELTIRDLLVVLPLGVLLYAYLSYGRVKTQT